MSTVLLYAHNKARQGNADCLFIKKKRRNEETKKQRKKEKNIAQPNVIVSAYLLVQRPKKKSKMRKTGNHIKQAKTQQEKYKKSKVK